MGFGALIRELQDGQPTVIRIGLPALLVGSILVLYAAFMLSPAMNGMIGLPGHELDRPVARPVVPAKPKLTPAQRRLARVTAVKVATSQLGVREHGGENRGSRIKAYRRAVTGPGEKAWAPEPWCADFVSWAWKRAGVPIGFNGHGSDYVPELFAWARLNRQWKWARTSYRPKAGDLVVFRANGSRYGHIGIVAKIRGGMIVTVEGNYRDRVMSRKLNPRAKLITGFIRPV